MAALLRERRDAAARRLQHVHPLRARRGMRGVTSMTLVDGVPTSRLGDVTPGGVGRVADADGDGRLRRADMSAPARPSSPPASCLRSRSAGSRTAVRARPPAAANCCRAADRPGVLAADRRVLRAGRVLPVRQPRLERGHVSVRDSARCRRRQARRRLSRRRPGSELHLHRRARAADRVHPRHPPRQPATCT